MGGVIIRRNPKILKEKYLNELRSRTCSPAEVFDGHLDSPAGSQIQEQLAHIKFLNIHWALLHKKLKYGDA